MKKSLISFLGILLLIPVGVVSAQTPANEFVYNNSAEPESLDPHRLTTHNDGLLVLQMFEGLLTRDRDYTTLKGAAAEKWDISKDGKTYTFTIRPNLKWSNGDPLTLEHIRNSFIRALDPLVSNQYILWYTDTIVGARELADGFKNADKRKELEEKFGVKIKGKNQIQIILKAPSAAFIQYVTQPPFSFVHPSMYDPQSKAWNDPSKFIVNGAYKMTEWKVNQAVKLEKNPQFREANSVAIPKITAMAMNDEGATLNLFRTNKIDWTGESTLSSTRVPSLRGDPAFRITPYFATATYLFNMTRAPFTDVRVRRALSLAIHRAELADKVMKGGQIPTTRFIPPGVKNYEYPVVPPKPFDRSIEEAKKLLAAAGFPEGKNFPKAVILYNTQEQNHRVAQAIQQMWKKYLNINLELQNMEWKVFIQEQRARHFDVSRQSWIADYPDPAQLLDIYMSDSGNNHTGWANAKFDKLLRDSASEMNVKKRMAMLGQAEKILMEEVPVVPLYHSVYFSLMSPRMEGFQTNMFGMYQFRYLSKKK
ncbi:MAG: peptide ABC transporter substrate-binding protein [Deltaproteobacteria bacterium]|nr:peptide ABC transporter substrate-binding protein [Deltaproteobacteria bacterium]